MAKDVIIACDFPSGEETLAFLDKFQGRTRPYVKIGMELFYAQGPDIVKQLKDRGHPVFLDLKLHDIPNTVGRAMRVLSHLGADMVNLHAAGGSAMMEAAIEGLSSGSGQRPLLIAVTQLTSTSQERLEQELRIPRPREEVGASYARPAQAAG
ncbi:MAG: orotidine-5'-phosphate decarboxylase, partial [Oscillospiraceae bacterium]|nr:orotidine-5'-phosphate decarboxylase [Oscillospiraceae bacterium]